MDGREALLAELVGMRLLFGKEAGPTHARYEKYYELAAGFPPGLCGITYEEEANNNKLSLHYVLLETHVALHWNSPGR